MRIACVHVPAFALQCVTRIDPSLRGAPVAVVGAGLDPTGGALARAALHGPVVQACSRAAWALGVRVGMTAAAARNASPEVRVVVADMLLERDTVRAIADALLGASPVVDLGGRVGAGGVNLALYCQVPSKTRGGTFGDRLIDRLDALGISCRVGIADDRFTAWVAASAPLPIAGRDSRSDDIGVVTVPRGGSAAFLSPRPLSLLAISPEVQHMLESLGVRTLGEFAGLPAPSIARPIEADYQALARGDSGNTLRPYAPDAPVRESASIAPGGALSGPAAVAMLAARLAMRLAGRGRGAARIEVTIGGEAGERVVVIEPVRMGRALETAEDLAEAIGSAIGELGAAWRLRVEVMGEGLAKGEVQAAGGAGAGAGVVDVGMDAGAVGRGAAAARMSAVAGLGAAAGRGAGAVAAGGVAVAGLGAAGAGGVVVAAVEDSAASAMSAGAAESAGAMGLDAMGLDAMGLDAMGLDALTLALSGVGPGGLSPVLRAERRDAHRRTQRGKRRTRASRTGEITVESLLQPKLFKNLP